MRFFMVMAPAGELTAWVRPDHRSRWVRRLLQRKFSSGLKQCRSEDRALRLAEAQCRSCEDHCANQASFCVKYGVVSWHFRDKTN